jgi:hypothetical protein
VLYASGWFTHWLFVQDALEDTPHASPSVGQLTQKHTPFTAVTAGGFSNTTPSLQDNEAALPAGQPHDIPASTLHHPKSLVLNMKSEKRNKKLRFKSPIITPWRTRSTDDEAGD